MMHFVRALILAFALTSHALAADTLVLNGAGATFPYPIYSKWFSEFKKSHATVEVNYQSIGSGGGIRQLQEKTVDFGASDAPMTDEQMAKVGVPVIHVPTVMGAVVITYNLPEIKAALKLDGATVANIFLGKITQWNDKAIAASNPGVKLPDTAIVVAHRSDGSGTTAVFADYLAKVSSEWKEKVGAGTALNWPVGLGGKGNEGVTGLVKQTPGSVGYVEFVYAKSNGLPAAVIKNKAGQFVAASPKSVSAAAAASAKTMPKDFRTSITEADGKDSYPISSFTYLLVYQKMDAKKGKAMLDLLNWVTGPDAQKLAGGMDYAPLPMPMVAQVRARIREVKAE